MEVYKISGQNIFYFKVEKVNKYKMEYYKLYMNIHIKKSQTS